MTLYCFPCAAITCSEPNISIGVETNSSMSEPLHGYETVLQLTCKIGYEYADGDTSIRCLAHEQWSVELLTCKRMWRYSKGWFIPSSQILFTAWKLTNNNDTLPLLEITCGDLPTVQHTYNNASSAADRHVCGDVIGYECAEGFFPIDGSFQRRCELNKQWSGEPLYCEENPSLLFIIWKEILFLSRILKRRLPKFIKSCYPSEVI